MVGDPPGGVNRRPARLLAAALLLIAAALASGEEQERPLTNVDVVRMIAAGMRTDRVLARIRSSPCAFDLAPDIVEELREAGVPLDVVDAMRLKGCWSPAPRPEAATPGEEAGRLEIAFEDDPERSAAENTAVAPARLVDPANPGVEAAVDLAFFAVCVDPTHAPDYWDVVSPIDLGGRRHEVLLVEASTRPGEGRKARKSVLLDHPASWEAEAPAGRHRALAGVGLRLKGEGKYRAILLEEIEGLEIAPRLRTRVVVRLRSGRARGERAKAGGDREEGGRSKAPPPEVEPTIDGTIEIVRVEPPKVTARLLDRG